MDDAPLFDPSLDGWVQRNDEPGFIEMAGPIWERRGDDGLILGFVVRPMHCNRRGVLHGGMLMTFADQALGLSAWEANAGSPQATIQLDTHFIAAVDVGEFVQAETRITRKTRSLIFMSGSIHVSGRVVATAQGIWKTLQKERNEN
ncbi:PaaI family thioesterase [Microvirga pudoricolor]|uniref:PaaI family thioesterase n=1 Tax=Microvirga pudoricolor TaxID=2778729 RepID=UPI0019509A3F|nr:PaaI family thioesterase [Microvirga pudoricolor]